MMLVDTSVWIDHLRSGDAALAEALDAALVLTHPCVVGELACGNIVNRPQVLGLLNNLPRAPVATHQEALAFIERHSLMGRGIAYTDAHLLASAALSDDARLWTRDRRLALLAGELHMTHDP
jgi:predicted nucleic acid-binding protein